jgi:hypothetical protein
MQADTFAASLEETHQTLCKNLQEAQGNQMKYAGGKEIVFKVGEKLRQSMRHIWMTRLSKKLD